MLFSAVHHVGLTVSDLDRSIAFYTLLLGAGPVSRESWDDMEHVARVVGYPGLKLEGAFFELPGGAMLELLRYRHPESGRVDLETYNVGNSHLCLLTADLAADFERLAGHCSFRSSAPVRVPRGACEGCAFAYLRDPDGISIELLEPAPGGLPPGRRPAGDAEPPG